MTDTKYGLLIDYHALPELLTVKRLVTHCSATRPEDDCQPEDITQWHCNPKTYTEGPLKGKTRWLGQLYNRWDELPKVAQRLPQGNGWLAPGYHLFIDQRGTITPLRPLSKVGAHASGFNSNSIGVCLAGGLDHNWHESHDYTDAQFEALAAVFFQLERDFSGAAVCGHNDLTHQKTCPNFDVEQWWNDKRKEMLE